MYSLVEMFALPVKVGAELGEGGGMYVSSGLLDG